MDPCEPRGFAHNTPRHSNQPREAKETRSAILAGAEDQFARRGYVATRLEDVAAAVGLSGALGVVHAAAAL